ncbi:MAG: tRNA (adenosine(37)-N6)-threonylcarbamoyltransferase complex dimerization subunit type 1 TsaB, partial [Micropruina sp.]
MNITLGIDTSTDVCCGLAVDGVVVASHLLADRRAHAEQLMPMIVEATAGAGVSLSEVTQIVVGIGPGPFTGLRVGVVTAQVIASVTGASVRGVCSLDGIAAQWVRSGAPEEFVIATDARRREVYWARYLGGQRVEGPLVTAAELVPALPLAGP